MAKTMDKRIADIKAERAKTIMDYRTAMSELDDREAKIRVEIAEDRLVAAKAKLIPAA